MVNNIPTALPLQQPGAGDETLYGLRQNIQTMYSFLSKAINGQTWSVGSTPVPPDATSGSLFANSITLANPALLASNAYYTGSIWKYIAAGPATVMTLSSGQFLWYIAPSGTAGATVPWVNYMTLTTGGLSVVGNVNAAGLYYSTGASAGYVFYDRSGSGQEWTWYASGDIARLYWTGYGDMMSVDTAANMVVVGNITSDNAIVAQNNITTLGGSFILNNVGEGYLSPFSAQGYVLVATNSYRFLCWNTNPIYHWQTGNGTADIMTLDTGGNLGLAGSLTVPGSITCTGNVVGNNSVQSNGVYFQNNSGWFYTPYNFFSAGAIGCGNTSTYWQDNGGWMYSPNSVWAAGNLTVSINFYPQTQGGQYCGLTGNSWAACYAYAYPGPSARAMKRDIADAPDGALVQVRALRVVNFRWKTGPDDDRLHHGFIADEAAEVFGQDFGAYTFSEDGERLDKTEMMCVLWKAVQELTARLETLEGRRDGRLQ